MVEVLNLTGQTPVIVMGKIEIGRKPSPKLDKSIGIDPCQTWFFS
jgi:hypothetical protein